MVPMELQIKKDDRRRAKRNIFVSWFSSSSREPMPSLSIRITFSGYSLYVASSSSVQHHSPLVQGLIVGPTPKPLLSRVLMITLFSKKDLPVLYLPATQMTPTGSFILDKNSLASSLTKYFSIQHARTDKGQISFYKKLYLLRCWSNYIIWMGYPLSMMVSTFCERSLIVLFSSNAIAGCVSWESCDILNEGEVTGSIV